MNHEATAYDVEAQQDSHPQGMLYRYFIAYYFAANDQNGFANDRVYLTRPITDFDGIMKAASLILEMHPHLTRIAIQNYILMQVEPNTKGGTT